MLFSMPCWSLINSTVKLVVKPTRKNPAITPASNGKVFFIPYFVLFTEQRILLGPGEKLRKTM